MSRTVHFFVATLFLFACENLWSQESTKGNWSEKDKNQAIADLNGQRKIFETFLDSTQIDPLIQCIADKLEQTFENPDAVDTESDTIQSISLQCLEAVGFNTESKPQKSTSVKGNWSEEEIAEAYQSLEYSRNVMNNVIDSSKVDYLFDCVVSKLQENFSNMDEAVNNSNDGISQLTLECLEEEEIFPELKNDEASLVKEEVGDPNSNYGDWSDEDKVTMEEQLSELRPRFEAQMGKEKTDLVFECVRFNFEHAFKNYADINNHPETYKAILDECSEKGKDETPQK
ncbi:MAG: hypothetical protein ACFHU9_08515 [Fluviicola sp.]